MKVKIYLAGLLLLLFSCKKEVKELPPATQTGANTFGAKIDGNLWVPQGFGPFPASNLLEARLLGNNFYLTAQNFSSSPYETEFDIVLIGLTGTGTFILNTDLTHPSSLNSYAYYVRRQLTPLNEWITSSAHTGSVTITRFDTAARIISGTFQFTGGEVSDAKPPVLVTEGRFDVKY